MFAVVYDLMKQLELYIKKIDTATLGGVIAKLLKSKLD